ncbi:hypothetical protein SLS60_000271 [Paraconiothyrium brasiliense]|uniref:Protein kinase domain-containing protein n=1 Tax=Paraconiothyrium brasiliense TaxID=300254 RepID=A0ABR3S6C5_9PLEO
MTDTDNASSYIIEDALTLTLPEFSTRPINQSANSILYGILSLAQTTAVDIFPIIHQPVLGDAGIGATTVIKQSFIGDGFELVFKEVESGPAFLRELSFLCVRSIRQHPFMVTLQGISWNIDDTQASPVIRPVMVFEKSSKGSLWSYMRSEVGRNLTVVQRLSFCIQVAIALGDLERLSKKVHISVM